MLVIGAGVSGLTTAIIAAEAGLSVRVIAADQPQQTTSAVAGAMIGPVLYPPDDRRHGWGEATIRELTGSRAVPGVTIPRGRLVARPADFLPPFADHLPGFQLCAPEDLPDGFGTGFWADIPHVDMPVYLDYLVHRLGTTGVAVEIGRLDSLASAARLARAIVNCAGLGARELAADAEVRPVRGPRVVVENPGLDTFFIEAPLGEEWISYHPFGDHVVLGGRAIDGNENLTPDPSEADAILAACAEVEPRLAGARILEHRVGLRPGRPDVRLEAEDVDGRRCVHNYGHGGSGVTLSWGCAQEVLRLVTSV